MVDCSDSPSEIFNKLSRLRAPCATRFGRSLYLTLLLSEAFSAAIMLRKCWASKFHGNLDKEVYVNGSNKLADVAEAFASHFSSVYTNSDDATSAKSEFDDICRGSS